MPTRSENFEGKKGPILGTRLEATRQPESVAGHAQEGMERVIGTGNEKVRVRKGRESSCLAGQYPDWLADGRTGSVWKVLLITWIERSGTSCVVEWD